MNTAKLKPGVLIAGLVGMFLPAVAAAFDAQQFTPAVDPQGYFSIYSSKTSPRGRFYVGAWYDYAKNTLNIQPGQNIGQLPGLLGPLVNPIATNSQLDGRRTKVPARFPFAVGDERDHRGHSEDRTECDTKELGAAQRDAKDGQSGEERDGATADARG